MIAIAAAACVFAAHGLLPDRRCTPGAAIQGVTTAQICQPGWAKAHRNVTSTTRRQVFARYGLTGPHPFPEWELDHLIPLELGGTNAITNLWPEHHPQDKDAAENRLHDRVCAGQMTLRAAQRIMAHDWRKAKGA